MKKKKIIFLLIQLVLIVGAGVLLYSYVQGQIKPNDVYVFTKDLLPNSQIQEDDIEVRSIPSEAVITNFVLNPEEIVGKYTSTKVFKDQFVVSELVITENKIDPFDSIDLSKLRKVSLPINYVEGFAGNLKKGNKVDLVYTGQATKQREDGSSDSSFLYSKVFLQDIYVYSVNTGDGYRFIDHSNISKGSQVDDAASDGEKIDVSADSDEIELITLAVTLEQAEEIVTRMNSGKIKIIGRFDDSKPYDTLGFVLGAYDNVFSGQVNVESNNNLVFPELTNMFGNILPDLNSIPEEEPTNDTK